MKRIKTLTVMAAVACCLASTSQATIVLAPGTSGPIGASSALDGAAGVIQGPTALGFASSAWTGVLTSTVLLESSVFNPLGGFTFVYHLALVGNIGTSTDALGRLTVIDWQGGSALIVGGNTGAGNAADTADRSLGAGGTIGFTWAATTPILVGTFGEVFVRTDSRVWNPSTAFVIDGGIAGVSTYAVPEPTTMIAGAMLLLPFGASTLRMLRKNRHGIIINKIS